MNIVCYERHGRYGMLLEWLDDMHQLWSAAHIYIHTCRLRINEVLVELIVKVTPIKCLLYRLYAPTMLQMFAIVSMQTLTNMCMVYDDAIMYRYKIRDAKVS